jgi:hypothetical protein
MGMLYIWKLKCPNLSVSETGKRIVLALSEEASLGDSTRLTIQSLITSEVCHLLYGPLLNREPSPIHNPGMAQSQLRDGSSEVVTSNSEEPDDTLRRMLGYLTGTKSFVWLTRRIQTFMSRSWGISLYVVTIKLLLGLKEETGDRRIPRISFSVDCDLKAYLKAASDSRVTLASIICVNTSRGRYEAITLGEYTARMWPATGAQLLELLQEWIDIPIDEEKGNRFMRKLMISFLSHV